ncbi:MAG: thioredoxin domain-containing protein [Chloroflexota bacterium]|nr:thioredoxin domain-containing protein [Chloroflexota bacterium]
MSNRLIGETSPYLREHAENPVDWYPWGEEALSRARQEDRPILLSIGYSACHWCHVMARECFEDQEIACLMNESFVNIKVDREERPDLDAIYMDAVQAMIGSGGWPLTVFLTPQGKPFYGGTYFPPQDRQNLPGFPRVLQGVAQAYKTRKGEVEASAARIIAHINRALELPRSVEPLAASVLSAAYLSLRSVFDAQNGGFGSAPKFPLSMDLEFLLRYHRRSGEGEALSLVERTLEGMAGGGLYDQIGGGFHRYSVDAGWLVPHFEKMLNDNALLSRLYLHAYQATGKPLYRRIAQETLDYVLRDMRGKEGGFCSAQDADSEGVEGKYYVWALDEVAGLLGKEDAGLVARYWGMTEHGNFEEGNVLRQAMDLEVLAGELQLAPEELETRIAAARARLLERRAERVAPHRDDKILLDGNGLMLASLAEAASVLGRDDYLKEAISTADFLMQALWGEGPLRHSYKDGQAKGDGYLRDYALLCEGLLALYQATFRQRWLRAALDAANAMLKRFWDEAHGGFYDTAHDQQPLVIRPRNVYDDALPSGSSAAAFVLLRLARLTDNSAYERAAASALRSVQGLMSRSPIGFGRWLCALDLYLAKPKEIAVVGRPGERATMSLMNAINQRYLPNEVLAGRDPDESDPVPVPLLQDRGMMGSRPTVYLCEGHVCRAPVTDPDALAALLDQIR